MDCGQIRSSFWNWYHQKNIFPNFIWQLNFLYFSDEKAAHYKYFAKRRWIHHYFYEFSSEALHIVVSENLHQFFASQTKSPMTWLQLIKNSTAAVIILQTNIRICWDNMYNQNIDLSLTILVLFLATNVCGLPDYCRKHKISLFCSNLAFFKNQTKISKEATE